MQKEMNISLTTCQEYEIAFEAKKGIKMACV